MEAKAKFLGHPIHQMLIVFPLGLLATAVIFDVIHLVTGSATMAVVAYWMIAASWFLRGDAPEDPTTTAFVVALAGAGVAAVSGWLGGELVGRLGVGVDDGAHLDAPSSLKGPAAR